MATLDLAACAGADVELFYAYDSGIRGAERARMTGEALALCESCPVRVECLAETMAREKATYRFGIWGGLTGNERQSLARRERRQQARVAA